MDYNEYIFSRRENIIFWSLMVTGSICLSLLFYGTLLLAFVPMLFYRRIKAFTAEELTKRRNARFLEQFKDLLFILSTSVGAGRGIGEGLVESMPSMCDIHGEDSLMYRELLIMKDRLQVGKEDEIQVLMDLGAKTGFEDVLDFVTVCRICRSTGGNLVLALNKAASVIIEKMTIENEINGIISRKEKEGLMIFAMPIAVIFFLDLMAGDYVEPLYSTIYGRLIMTGVIAADVGLYGMIRRIIRVRI